MPNQCGIVYRIIFIACLMICSLMSYSQALTRSYNPSFQDTTIIAFLGDLERSTDISLSYSTSQFDAYKMVSIPSRDYTISEALTLLFSDYQIDLIERSGGKVIISVTENTASTNFITVKGTVLDKGSGEKLYGAALYHMGNNRGVHTNNGGFFSISNIQKGDVLRASYIGYRDEFITVDSSYLIITLSPAAEVSTIIITEILSEYINPDTGGDVIDLNSASAKVNILGEKDVLHMARQKPGVYSGSEGFGGLIVRGGSQDQNLLLLEDVPMYAVNHMAGISSIFMEGVVRDAQIIRGGFPSRYSGRLSSVLEVQLKDGNQEKFTRSVSAGLPGFKAVLEGPLTEKASILVAGRLSWINAYIDPIIRELTVFDNLDLEFHDFIAKYTYRFSNTSTFSISGYKGGDNVRLDKNQVIEGDASDESFSSQELNSFGWNNSLLSMKFTSVLSDKWYLSTNAGLLGYNYSTRASYDFTTTIDNEIISNDKRSLVTSSGIVNALAGLELDYFINSDHKLKLGGGINHHRFSPKIEQSVSDIDIDLPEIDPDSITVANEVSFFVEDTYTPNKKMQLYAGLNYTRFGVRETSYSYLQPRLKFTLKPQKGISLNVTGSRMVQFVHLLVNNGLGLPSDLWVPSTDEIAPQISDQFGFTMSTYLGLGSNLTIGGFIKRQQNIILYKDPQDLFSAILNNSSSESINFINDRDWERRIEAGKRNITGIEVSLVKSHGPWQYNISYTRFNTENRFDNLNRGNAFLDRYDRPHDINLSTSYQLNKKWNLGVQWTYGSGNTISVPLVEIPVLDGGTVLTQDQFNNYRMEAFHHLDLIGSYDNTHDGKGLKLSFGIYNVYNRYNPYHIYAFRDQLNGDLIIKRLSLFPLLPHFNIAYSY